MTRVSNSFDFSRRLIQRAALLLIIPGTALAETDNVLTPDEHAAGWQLLFDGQSMQHWRTYGQDEVNPGWQVKDGAIVLVKRGGGDLITRSTFTNFELKLTWRIAEGGNSGIFFNADESSLPIFVHAPEIQILDDARHPDNKKANRRSGSLYDMIAAPPAAQKPAEQWNQVVISHQDGHLQAWQNGVMTVDIQLRSELWDSLVAQSKFSEWPGFGELSSGHIGLQDHGDVVAFKNLKIRSLPGADTL